jgi:tetratricopeptide (TPR) repeat protein
MRAANEEHLWGKSYERQVGDALALQDEIAGAIAQEVGGALAPVPARPAPARSAHANGPAHAAAVQAYLRGRDEYQHWTLASNRQALQHYDRALALDPTFTQALAARASSLIFLSASPDTMALAREAVTKALALDPGIGEAHAEYGKLLYGTDWDWQGAEREFKRAIELNPNDSDAHHHYSHLLLALGRAKEARDEANLMASLDPLAPATWNHMGFMDYMAGDMAAAERDERKALELDPGYVVSYETFLDVALLERNWSAFPVLLAHMKEAGVPIDPLYVRMIDAIEHGRKADAVQAMRSMSSKDDPFPWAYTHLAEWALAAGDREEAFAWLNKGLTTRDYELLFINYDPALASLRSDPRYGALRDRMGLPR